MLCRIYSLYICALGISEGVERDGYVAFIYSAIIAHFLYLVNIIWTQITFGFFITAKLFIGVKSKLKDVELNYEGLRNLQNGENMIKDFVEFLKEEYSANIFCTISQSFIEIVRSSIDIAYGTPKPTPFLVLWLSYRVFQIFAMTGMSVYSSHQVLLLPDGTGFMSLWLVINFFLFQAEQTANYLHELFIENDDPAIREEVRAVRDNK